MILIKHLIADFEMIALKIVIMGDDNFYSDTSGTIEMAKKTGLGSSAALVTGLVGGLLSHFLYHMDVDLLQLIHNTSQFVHCFVQGKIGSGFDVSAAVYGSQVYRRFSPQVIQDALNLASNDALSGDKFSELVCKR
jgi:phosphomevalonate kinase